MQKNQIIILVIAASFILLMLVSAVYILLNSSTGTMDSMMGGTTTNNSIIALVLIAAAIITSMAVLIYFVYSKNEKTQRKNIETLDDINLTKTQETTSTTCQNLNIKEELSKPFDVFLCYKKSSGKDYADHLKGGLEELGLHTFEDCRDIPRTVETEEGWAMVRDKALQESKYFVLIMTPGFDLSSEVIKEVAMARKIGNKSFVFFRHRSMGRKIVLNLGDEILDIGKLEQVSFETKEELLRLASNILSKGKTT